MFVLMGPFLVWPRTPLACVPEWFIRMNEFAKGKVLLWVVGEATDGMVEHFEEASYLLP